MNKPEILARIKSLGDWYHNINLGNGIWTVSSERSPARGENHDMIVRAIPADLTGKHVLDIGCNAGHFSIVCKKRNAARVVGVDRGGRWIEQARFCAEVLDLDIDYRELNVVDLHTLGETFDLVLFIGVLYHIDDELKDETFRQIGACCTGTLILETATSKQGLKAPKPMNLNRHPNLAEIRRLLDMGGFKKVRNVFIGGRSCIVAQKV